MQKKNSWQLALFLGALAPVSIVFSAEEAFENLGSDAFYGTGIPLIQQKKPGYSLSFNYLDEDGKLNKLKKLYLEGGEKIEEQFKYVLKFSLGAKTPFQLNEDSISSEATSAQDMQQLFGFIPLGYNKFKRFSAGKLDSQALENQRINSLRAVAVDADNNIYSWTGLSWTLISAKTDHCHGADVAFTPVLQEAKDKAADKMGFGSMGRGFSDGWNNFMTGAEGFFGTSGSARLNYYNYSLNFPKTSFFRITSQATFPKQVAMSPNGDSWVIGGDAALYWGGHPERYKYLTSKDPRNFFIPGHEKVYRVAACDKALAALRIAGDGKLYVVECKNLADLQTWSTDDFAKNSLFSEGRVTQLPWVPEGVSKLVYGPNRQQLYAITPLGIVLKRSAKGWDLFYDIGSRFVSNLSIVAEDDQLSGKAMLVNRDGTVELLVDSERKIWRKLQKLMPQEDGFLKTDKEPLKVSDANMLNDGSACFLAGGDAAGGYQLFFVTREQLVNFGSPIGHLNSGDSIVVRVGPNEFLGLGRNAEIVVETKDLAQAKASTSNLFKIFRYADIFALRAANGQWLKFPSAASPDLGSGEILATEKDAEMDKFGVASQIDTFLPNEKQLVATLQNGEAGTFYCEPIVRLSGGKIEKNGNFLRTIDSASKKIFTSSTLKFVFFKVSSSRDLPLYLKVAESQTNLSVQIGFYMQALKDYVPADDYSSKRFFTNLNQTKLDAKKPTLSLLDILQQQWKGEIPTFVDEATFNIVLTSISSMLDNSKNRELAWSEGDANNMRNLLAKLIDIFTRSPQIIASIEAVAKKFADLAIARLVTFDQFFNQTKDFLARYRENFEEPTLKSQLTNALNILVKNRVLGESAGDNYSKLKDASEWLMQRGAELGFSRQESVRLVGTTLQNTALMLVLPISIDERFDLLEGFLTKIPLIANEASILRQQLGKVLEPAFVDRLIPSKINRLKDLVGRLAMVHKLKPDVAILEAEKSDLNRIRQLRDRLLLHVGQNGWWDSSKDGTVDTGNGLKLQFNAYTPYEFVDDLEALIGALYPAADASNPKLADEYKLPLKLMVRQMLDSLVKGPAGKKDDYSSLVKRLNQYLSPTFNKKLI